MPRHTSVVVRSVVLVLACGSSAAHQGVSPDATPTVSANGPAPSRAQGVSPRDAVGPLRAHESVPDQEFTHPPEKPHDPAANFFRFDQLDHLYRVPGEFTHRLTGDQYGFESLSFIITETHPGGGPGLHVYDTEEAHVLLEGSARYRIGDQTITVQAPYVAKVPAGVPHTFINAGATPFNLVAVFASKHPNTRRIGPNPLIPAPKTRDVPRPDAAPR